MSVVNESGLYAPIFISRKPEANAFRRCVTSEVLPSIRRTGHCEAQLTTGNGRPDDGHQAVATLIATLDRPRRETEADRQFLDWLADYPFSTRDAVFCWLWANHAQVSELRTRWDGPTWHDIARIMRDDGVNGARGEPPNANSVRRVWGRVCREIATKPKTFGTGQPAR